ncbi:TPA: hypothetical protein JF904_000556 [Legionella pneumophila]|uniref:hypothetical protein n=1 Tax=Legionella pneumophila TaxID=446 RepID=UPI000770A5C7|nr:hypothetical protein [Legionella pneumophila]CZG24327.1 Uncharacterised protein [Legionella pneumophila]HAT1901403.1 hypothetical protein [Legionella pneumophila]HAT1980375.1 hypothetical protein [Legionella pneumophila]HAT4422697.1 hypothetical protein [Legionella pneumophila]HAU0875307.1 hypothetical protein [Legionella pneumophila]
MSKSTMVINWETNGHKPSEIIYMVLNDDMEYLIKPTKHSVTQIKKDIDTIFSNTGNIDIKKINCKTIVEQYNGHRNDSLEFHNSLIELCKNENWEFDKKAPSFKGRNERKKFRLALNRLNIPIKHVYEMDLWATYLKATKRRLDKSIKQIWTKKHGSLKVKGNRELFTTFLKELNKDI